MAKLCLPQQGNTTLGPWQIKVSHKHYPETKCKGTEPKPESNFFLYPHSSTFTTTHTRKGFSLLSLASQGQIAREWRGKEIIFLTLLKHLSWIRDEVGPSVA